MIDKANPAEALPSFRERVRALRFVLPLIGMVWRTSPALTAWMILLRLVRAGVPVLALWVGKLIVDAVVAGVGSEGAASLSRLWRLVALELLIVVAGEVLARVSSLVESLLGDLFSIDSSVRLMNHAATLDLTQLEDPDFYDRLDRARRQTVGRLGLLTQLLTTAQDSLTLISLAAVLIVYSPLLLLLLATAIIPSFLGETHFAGLEYSLHFRRTPERRQLDYLRFLGASERGTKEVQMFGLADWLVGRYRQLSERFYDENKRLSVRRAVVSTLLSLIATVGYYAAYVVIVRRAALGLITLGTLTLLSASFLRSRDLIQRFFANASGIYQQSLHLKDLFDFFAARPTLTSPIDALSVPRPIRDGFVFEDVGFKYPGAERWALRHVSFRLDPGDRLAFVGENGAGKTTLTKLFARLYDPTEGRILLDGVDLRDYDLESLRRTVGVIFQDFVRYDMPFDENIGVGNISEARDYFDLRDGLARDDAAKNPHHAANGAARLAEDNGAGNIGTGANNLSGANENVASELPQEIIAAADKSRAATLLPRLPEGYAQMLGRRFEGGVDLSGGEWQKIALARAYVRDAQLLILDEPTAALDARAEYAVFERFSELMIGRIAVIISHRFSTVRMADRIIVLEAGGIIEQGTHAELVRRAGVYAELFKMQAEGYR